MEIGAGEVRDIGEEIVDSGRRLGGQQLSQRDMQD